MNYLRNNLTIENLLLLVILLVPLYILHITILSLPTNIFELLAFISIFLWIIFNKKSILKIFRSLEKKFFVSLLLIFTGLTLSTVFNVVWKSGFGILKSWFIIPIFFALIVYKEFNTTRKAEKVLRIILFSGALVAIISIFYKILGIVTYDNRLSAFCSSPNYLAMFLSPAFFISLYFLINDTKNYQLLLLDFFQSIIILCSIILTYSLGNLAAITITLCSVYLLLAKYQRKLFYVLCCVFLFFTLALIHNPKRILSITQNPSRSSLASRAMIWKTSMRLLQKHPIVGIGPGNFQNAYLAMQPYFPPYLEWAVPQPHNIYLAFWLECGLFGLIGFMLLLFYIFKLLLKTLLSNNKKERVLLAALFFSYFLYIAIYGLIDTPYWKNDLSFVFWIFVMLSLNLNISNNRDNNPQL